MAGAGDISTRLTLVERNLERLDRDMAENRKSSSSDIKAVKDQLSGEIREVKEDLSDKINEVVLAHSTSEHELASRIGSVERSMNTNIEKVLEKLATMNNRMAVISAAMTVVGSLFLVIFGSYTKASFDHMNKNQQTIQKMQNQQEPQEFSPVRRSPPTIPRQ